jgi:hypothetical protein
MRVIGVACAAALSVASLPAGAEQAPAAPGAAKPPASASATGQVQFNILSVQGLVTGAPILVDAKFGQTHKVAVPAPFRTLAPMHASFQTLVVNAPKPGTAFLKLNFTTPDGKTLLENLQFVPLEVPMGPVEQRLQQVSGLLTTVGVQRTTEGKANPTVKIVRHIKSGPYDAVEVIGTYETLNSGLTYYRMVGIVNPKSKDCVMALSNVIASRVNVVSADDFPKTRAGVATAQLRFAAP